MLFNTHCTRNKTTLPANRNKPAALLRVLFTRIVVLCVIFGISIFMGNFVLGAALVCFPVEVDEHDEKDDSIGPDPINESHWVVTVYKQQLRGVDDNQDELRL